MSGLDSRNPDEVTFALGRGNSQRALVGFLRGKTGLQAERRQSRQITFYDTFDWRLHRRGLRLSGRDTDGQTELVLRPIDGDGGASLRVDKLPAFAVDLPRGALRGALEPIVKVRRLLPVVRVQQTCTGYRVLDEERKTLVRLWFEQARAELPSELSASDSEPAAELAHTLRVTPLPGYGRAQQSLLCWLDERSGLEPVSDDLAARAFAAIGRSPVVRSSGLQTRLDAEAPVGASFLALHRELFATLRANERGIRTDLDTEHLHDFRVAVRRTRLLYKIARHAVVAPELATLKDGFRWLGKITNETRDLDVHLIELRRTRERLPAEADALLPVEAILRERRRAAWEQLVASLDSATWSDLETAAGALLDPPQSDAAARIAALGPPTGSWAAACIERAWRRLRKHGRRIAAETPEAQIHRVRLDGKSLRYRLEFFRSLYPEDAVEPLVKELKRLQDNLGRFNDARVQSDLLRQLARDLAARGTSADSLLAVGRLVERAELRMLRERERFHERFTRFDARPNRERFRALCGGTAGRRA